MLSPNLSTLQPDAWPLERWQTTLGWQPNLTQCQQFQHLYQAILAGNRHLNLTRITDEQDFWEKHLWDSLRGINSYLHLDSPSPMVMDVGTGGGFPGLPIAIALPHSAVTVVDSTAKKIQFIRKATQEIPLANVTGVVGRAEAIGQHIQYREQYDLALIRAVGPAPVCAEYTVPFLKIGGTAILYRGQWTGPEAKTLTKALAQLGGKLGLVQAFKTPLSQGVRHCLQIHKTTATPTSYPRAIGIPKQIPLGES
jgi:16S rRNA (guanine527-N7)-methyltransferase